MSEAPVTTFPPGWWGKLPHLGDFASRRLPEGFIAGWDEWLRRGLAGAREALGPRWLEGYLVAPVLRFWLAPGLLGAPSWSGLVMPSVDRVGRHFPLTLARPGLTLAQARAATAWFEALEGVARQVLDVNFSVEDLERALAAALPPEMPLEEPAAAEPEEGSFWWFADVRGERCCRFGALPPVAAFTALLGERA